MARVNAFPLLIGLLAIGGCAAELPTSPEVMALPAKGKDLAQFQREDIACREHAQQQAAAPISVGNPHPSSAVLQQRYDIAYAQCMAADGNPVLPPPYGSYGYVAAYPPYYGPWLGPSLTLGWFGGVEPHFHHHHTEQHATHHAGNRHG
jgi:hypothetical protein